MWDNILETLKISPEHGDWTAALLTAFIFMIHSVVFMIKTYKESKEKRILEEKDLYQELKKSYNELWLHLTAYSPKILYCDYNDRENMKNIVGEDVEKVRTYVYQVIDNLADVYFMYYSRESRYWARWESIIEYVFTKRLFNSSWPKMRKAFECRDPEFVLYIDQVVIECAAYLNKPEKKIEEVA
jgi:hypothetical protein